MIVFPAIDLRRGRCVRLRQGDAEREMVFGADPARVAQGWIEQGAEWLHVVNLDGAFGEAAADNLSALRSILQGVDVPVQFGGGIRTLEDVERSLTMGVARVILGTVAVRQPEIVEQAIGRFGADQIVVGIDAREGMVATHGWLNTSDVEAGDLAQRMADLGVRRIVYTDVQRDGMLSGVNVEATRDLARHSGLAVIASGGVRSLADIRAVKVIEADGVEGVIVGMALYRGTLALAEALQVANQ